MAQSQEEILRSPYPELLLEMVVVRMATLEPVLDAAELMRVIDAAQGAQSPSAANPSTVERPRGRAAQFQGSAAARTQQADEHTSGGMADAPARPAHASGQLRGVQHLKVEGEVKADAPLRVRQMQPSYELPELREHIRSKKSALAAFMEYGASLRLEGDVLTVAARTDIYVRYFQDHLKTLAELASEFYQRPLTVKLRIEAPDAEGASGAPTPSVAPASQAVGSNVGQSAISAAQPRTDAATVIGAGRDHRESRTEALRADPMVQIIVDQLDARLLGVRSQPHRVEIESTAQEEQKAKRPLKPS
jgi:hypothetical protein